MVAWKHLPPALSPTKGSPDQDGCWSGCAVRDVDGTVAILYTGVRLRCKEEPQHDLHLDLPMIETQCLATAAPGDSQLVYWTKAAAPIIPLPPHKNLGAFRDPFVLGMPGQHGETEWTIMLGSGIKNTAGTALVYKSPTLQSGWRYDGELCRGIGLVWECPVMASLPLWQPLLGREAPDDYTPVGTNFQMALEDMASGDGFAGRKRSQQLWQQYRHMLAVCPDDCKNAIRYYLGSYSNGRFDMENAIGPLIMDHGDILYAPQILAHNPEGHAVLFGWVQERRATGTYSYAGCLCMPRLLWLEVDPKEPENGNGARNAPSVFLRQQPLPGLQQLRSMQRKYESFEPITVTPSSPFVVPEVRGLHWEAVLHLEGSQGTTSALALRMAESLEGCPLLLYTWASGRLEVVYRPCSGAGHNAAVTEAPDEWPRVAGGVLQRRPAPGELLVLHVFFDYSVLEVFTDKGEVLTTRIYPSEHHAEATIELLTIGGTTIAKQLQTFELQGIFSAEAPSEAVESEVIDLQDKWSDLAPNEATQLEGEAAKLEERWCDITPTDTSQLETVSA